LEINYQEFFQPELPPFKFHNNREQQQNQHHDICQGLPVRQKKAQFASINSKKLFFMIFVIVVFGIVVTSLFRTGQNHINPITFIVHFLSFILTPLIIIWQNQNLKSFTVVTVKQFLSDYLRIFSIFKARNQIHPVII